MERKTKTIIFSLLALVIVVLVILASTGVFSPESQGNNKEKTLKVLGWIGYDEEKIVEPFEEKYNVDVKVKTFVGGDEMFSILSQSSPGEYDVVVIDPEYVQKLDSAERIRSLDEGNYNFSNYVEPFNNLSTTYIDGELKSVVVRYGTNALVYNTEYFNESEVQSYDVLWSEKAKGKIGVWDWYLPTMGTLSMADGNSKDPYQLNKDEFSSLKNTTLSLESRVSLVSSSLADIKQAFVNEDIIISPGVGTYLVAYDLRKEGHPIKSTIPEEGGIMWIETLGITKGSENPELAKKFIQYMQEPKTQANLATLDAYTSGVPNKKAIKHLPEQEKELLRLKSEQQMESFVDSLFIRELPNTTKGEQEWQSVWKEFKSG